MNATPTATVAIALRPLDSVLWPRPEHWLSHSEADRLASIGAEPRRRQYLAGHWLAREVLAAIVGDGADACALEERRSRPPAVIGRDELSVSISHSGDWIAAACGQAAIGLDIEQRRAREALRRFEQLLLAEGEAPGSLDDDALLQRWVVKEAYIKRDAGSALPERLRELVLRSGSEHDRSLAAHRSVRLWGHEALWLGLALSTPARLSWLDGEPTAKPRLWRVEDRAG